ncbi:MAG: hypothetical protein ACK5LO_00510 [Leucobacter sp.]
MSRKHSQPAPSSDPVVKVPPVLPHVQISVNDGGTLTVLVDGVPYPPPEYSPAWQRSSFPIIIQTILAQRQSPIRVTVTETDGQTFTDFFTPPKPRTPWQPEAGGGAPSALAVAEPVDGQGALPVAVSAANFIPGEDVAVAVVLTLGEAGADGVARAMLTVAQLAQSRFREVLLHGLVSGRTVTLHPETQSAGAES